MNVVTTQDAPRGRETPTTGNHAMAQIGDTTTTHAEKTATSNPAERTMYARTTDGKNAISSDPT